MNQIKNLLTKIGVKPKVGPKERQVYAVGTGTYVGELLVFVKKVNDNYCFLSVPKNRNRIVPIDKFDFAMEHKIMEIVEELPKPVYKLCVAQFVYNEKHPKKPELPSDELK